MKYKQNHIDFILISHMRKDISFAISIAAKFIRKGVGDGIYGDVYDICSLHCKIVVSTKGKVGISGSCMQRVTALRRKII